MHLPKLLLLLSFFCLRISLSAQILFDSDSVLDVQLVADWAAINADRGDDHIYRTGSLRMKGYKSIGVDIRTRGNFRKRADICTIFPPLRIVFDEHSNRNPIFGNYGKIKLVTHCYNDELVLREYLIYKMYNLISDMSFKVRLVRMTYIDEKGELPPAQHLAFFIESEELLADRVQGTPMEPPFTTLSTNRESFVRIQLFNYLIGNRDWGVDMSKNVKMIRFAMEKLPHAVPYDFDWSQAVDAPYSERYKGPNYEARELKPICIQEHEWQKAFAAFTPHEQAIYQLYRQEKGIDPVFRSEIISYYKEFFRMLKNKKAMKKVFLAHCND